MKKNDKIRILTNKIFILEMLNKVKTYTLTHNAKIRKQKENFI